jgi:hypothetical protein
MPAERGGTTQRNAGFEELSGEAVHGTAKTKRPSNHQSPRRPKIYHNAIQGLFRRLENFLARRRVLVFKLPCE